MVNQELEILFKKMLEEIDELVEKDEILKKDMENFNLKIQFRINGIKGYQIFDNGNYIHKYGKEVEQADLTLEFADKDIALKFLRGDVERYQYIYYKRKFRLYIPERIEIIERDTGPVRIKHLKPFLTAKYTRGIVYHPFVLSKLPIFRKIIVKEYGLEDSDGSYIPINTALGKFDNQILPAKLIDYFINKSNTIYIQTICGCRLYHDCQDYDKFIGCMYLGKDVANLKLPPEQGRFITKKEASKHVDKAIKNGLVPTFGRFTAESNGLNVEDTGHFMSMCFCCPCCCINGKMIQNATTELQGIFKRMEGLTVKVDPDTCIGCGICMDICVFIGRSMVDGKAVIDQDKCLGCGRCERICPSGAISITLDDPKRLDEFIERIERSVDVT
ncbi:MAG: indolepyruvate ferredoxin oxidoreductase subunit alpha [Promethearchaeota archaeon]